MFRPLDRTIRARRFRYMLPVVIAVLSLFILTPRSSEARPQASIRYVATTGVDSPDCTLPANPCLTVQYAVDQAVEGDAIHIAAGTYTGVTTRFIYDRQLAYISKTLMLQGGYTTTDSFAESNAEANPTILDAQNDGRVLTFDNVDGDVANITVQNGNGNGNDGGGILAPNALTLTNVSVMSNSAELYTFMSVGGGVAVYGVAHVTGGLFQNNRASYYGGGLAALNTLVMTGTRFISNTAFSNGGGVAAMVGEVTLNGVLFQGNSAIYGGGLDSGRVYNPLVLVGTQFISNTATFGGGAIMSNGAHVNGGLFQNNSALYGGGLYTGYAGNTDTLALTGTQFLGNTSVLGGGIYHAGGNERIVNVLFARNVATGTLGAALYLNSADSVQILYTTISSSTLGSGSAIYIGGGTVGITDTIIDNYSIGISRTAGSVYEDYNLFSSAVVSKTGLFVVGSGANDVVGDPNFVDPAADNYHVQIGAAIGRAIDAGVNVDLDGNARPGISGFDIGAYQYAGSLFRIYLPLAPMPFDYCPICQ